MKTDDLIATLARDARATGPSANAALAGAVAAAIVLAAIVFFSLLGPRPDITAAAATARFLLKFVITAALALTALAAVAALARPKASNPRLIGWLALAPAMLAIAVLSEMMLVPSPDWYARWIGNNSRLCLVFIPLIGLAPLAVLLGALRRGAPTRPRLAGAVAGLLAGGIAATFYAAHCADDSPLFVATWYSIAILGLAALGALAGARALRW